MTRTVRVQQAKTHLSAILTEVEHGAEVVIARGDEPVARLTPIGEVADREMGFVPYVVPDTFFEPLPAEELDAWQQ
ncbi:MAG: type II toxin-antitoxin system Phd/YefM family antitoxin [Nocardioidaceae bacterium]